MIHLMSHAQYTWSSFSICFPAVAIKTLQVLFLVTFRDITAFKQPIVDDDKEVGGIGGD